MAKGKKNSDGVKAVPGASKWAACGCKHDFQSSEAKRLGHPENFRLKICNSTGAWNCTVCNKS